MRVRRRSPPSASRPGSFFDHRKNPTGRWADVFDGVVVFRTERPPARIDERD